MANDLRSHIRAIGGWDEVAQLDLWLRGKKNHKGPRLFNYLKLQWIQNEKARKTEKDKAKR